MKETKQKKKRTEKEEGKIISRAEVEMIPKGSRQMELDTHRGELEKKLANVGII